MNEHSYIARLSSMEWDSAAPGVRRKLHKAGDRQLRVVELGPGFEHPEWCETGHIGYVLEGRLALEFDNETFELATGDGFLIPQGHPTRHRPILRTDRVVLLLSEQT
jgi:quercetin dioxygenase-like cupin family protein